LSEPEEEVYDLKELEDDRRRNEEDRKRMLDAYASWLKERGIIQPAPKRATRHPPSKARPARRSK
jgi:hypothetical protein